MSIRLFARNGEHCPTLLFILDGRPIPADLQAECEKERRLFLADSTVWMLRHYGPEKLL